MMPFAWPCPPMPQRSVSESHFNYFNCTAYFWDLSAFLRCTTRCPRNSFPCSLENCSKPRQTWRSPDSSPSLANPFGAERGIVLIVVAVADMQARRAITSSLPISHHCRISDPDHEGAWSCIKSAIASSKPVTWDDLSTASPESTSASYSPSTSVSTVT